LAGTALKTTVGLNLRVKTAVGLLVLAIAVLFLATLSPEELRGLAGGYRTFVTIFLGIFIEALPFLLLGTLASGLVEVFVSRDALGRVVPHNRLGAVVTGGLMGLAFPVCECGVVPLTRRLFRKGVPLSVGVAFMLAAPVINPVVIASTYAAFGWGPVFVGRFLFTLLIAVAVGLIFSVAQHPLRLLQPSAWPTAPDGTNPACRAGQHSEELSAGNPTAVNSTRVLEAPISSSLSHRLTRALVIAGDELFEMGKFLVVGCLLAAGMQTLIPQSALLSIGSGALVSVVAMLVLAFVLSVCSTVDAFLALAFVNTFTVGSILAFLVFGPMVDIKSVVMFTTVFRPRVVLYLVLLPLMMSLFLGLFLNLNMGW
jgi:uncharacterized membrane protein YraQ (UPF0718 family)